MLREIQFLTNELICIKAPVKCWFSFDKSTFRQKRHEAVNAASETHISGSGPNSFSTGDQCLSEDKQSKPVSCWLRTKVHAPHSLRIKQDCLQTWVIPQLCSGQTLRRESLWHIYLFFFLFLLLSWLRISCRRMIYLTSLSRVKASPEISDYILSR